jgi:hypothetical protein
MLRQINDHMFLVISDDRTRSKKMVTLRVNEDVVNKYDKLSAILNTQYNVEISRTKIMELVLERAIYILLNEPRTVLLMLEEEQND